MIRILQKFVKTDASGTTLLIRIMVGAIFFSEGLQKFIFPAARGAGRFAGIGFPAPEAFANFVGAFEVLGGLLILVGLLTRAGALFTFVIISVAITVTKIPIGLGHSFGPFILRQMSHYGFWSMAHEMRTDFAMWLGSLFLMIRGGGKWSLDATLFSKKSAHR